MGQVRHGIATTTHAVRAAIQRSQASLATLSREFGINPKTVAKWRKRTTDEDMKTGPKAPHSTTLTEAEEAMVAAFRRHTLLPLDDCLYALQPSVPHLTRSALHRCLQRHGISRLPDVDGDKSKRQRFKRYPIGFFHMDIAEVQTAQGKLYLFVAIDRTSKFAVTQLVDKADRRTAWEFLEHLLKAVPYRIHTILTDNGIQFADQPRNRNTVFSRQMRFDMICEANDIEHRLTKPNHPWTNGQVERMNRTIKDATVKRFHYDSHEQLRTHLADFINATTSLVASITTQNFDEGRAGSNNIGTDGKNVPVNINATALKGYTALSAGISYLVAHETAHALNSMQTYNKQQRDAYVNGPGAGLSYEQQVAQYPSSDQFKANEARANTVGRALLALLNRPASGFEPTNGYQVC